MAYQRIDTLPAALPDPSEELIFSVNNGDLRQLRELVKDYAVSDELSLIKYAISVLLIAKVRGELYVHTAEGDKLRLSPKRPVTPPPSPDAL